MPLKDLPQVDAVLISHDDYDHYDHLGRAAVRTLAKRGVRFVTALGVGTHLEAWGIPAERVTELDWWETATIEPSGVTITATPSQHFSGRTLLDRNATAWSSFHLKGPTHSVFHGADTGLTQEYHEIRERQGAFDLVLLEIGAYHPAWGDIHLVPEHAIEAHSMLGSGRLLPIHWGTFNLAMHAWDQPIETLTALAPARGIRLVTPQLGQPVEPLRVDEITPWWRSVVAEELRSGKNGDVPETSTDDSAVSWTDAHASFARACATLSGEEMVVARGNDISTSHDVTVRRTRRWTRVALTLLATLTTVARADAQVWRDEATHLGSTTRVLVVGTRPEDEDNALIAWLSRGRHLETAVLSLTRGESGRNVAGAERDAPLAVVRTAEVLAERAQDGAHQYFTRAFDLGATTQDSAVARAWPRDSVLIDVVSVIRAFRPHVVILLNGATDDDAGHRFTARLTTAAFAIAADTVAMPSRITARLPAWSVSQLFTRLDTAATADTAIRRIDVGAFDRTTGRSYAELGAEIRRLQRTQGLTPPPPPGSAMRLMRLDSTRVGRADLFNGAMDSTLARHRLAVPDGFVPTFDTLRSALTTLAGQGSAMDADTLAARVAHVIGHAIALRLELPCRDESGVPTCDGAAGDLATWLTSMRERASAVLLGAAGIVIDGNAARDLVAAGDTVSVALRIHNGGRMPVTVRRLALSAQGRIATVLRDTAVVLAPAASVTYSAPLRFLSPTYHWWQINGMVSGTLLHKLRAGSDGVAPELIRGEDRLPGAQVEATVVIAGVALPVIVKPVASRAVTALRGDVRHPVIGVPETSLLLERGAEYERANQSVDRLFRVFVSNTRSTADTLQVSLALPAGLRADSAHKTVPVPALSARNVFFRLTGALPAGMQEIAASAHSVAAIRPDSLVPTTPREFTLGVVINEYPHIPTQHFVRFAKDRVESIALKMPPNFRVAYIRGTEDLRPAFQQLRLGVMSLDMALVPVADLTGVTAVLIGAGALRGDAALLAVPVLKAFAQRGGVVVVLPGGRELSRVGLLPFDVDMTEIQPGDEGRGNTVQLVDAASPLAKRPNALGNDDLDTWVGDRSCSRSRSMFSGWEVPIVVTDRGQTHVEPAVMTAPVGKGRVTVTSLCLAQQLEGARPAAAKLLVNMLSYGRAAP